MKKFLKKYKNLFLFGLGAGLAFPPVYLIIFLPFSFYYLLNKIIDSKNSKQAFLDGLIFGFGYFLVQLYWISFSLIVDIKTYFWLFPFAITFIPLICAIYFAFSTLITFFIIKKFEIKNKFLITFVFSLSYVIFEYIRGLIFPWNLFSYILGFSDILIQVASIVNIHVLNFITIIFFGFGFVLFEYKNKKILFVKKQKYYSIIYFIICFSLILFGGLRLHNPQTKKFNLKFRLVQANIPQTLKWDDYEISNNLVKHHNLTKESGLNDVDFVIWSESSIPYILTENSILPKDFDYMRKKVFITGAVRADIADNKIKKIWNSIFIFENGRVFDYYDKSLLVPFGEYIPFSKYIPFMKKITNGSIDFSKGDGNKIINVNNIKISPMVCYEIVFPDKIISNNDKPDIIINLTNDAWFGNSSGPYQHLVAAKFRAVENKIPILRVANSGITAYIDEYGRVIKKLELNTSGILDI